MEDFLDHNQQHHHNQDFHSSPFLSDNIELRPPTPPYGYSGSPLPSTAHLPDTPSYAGSFHSPYSAHSDLSFADQQDFSNDFAFLDDPSNPKLLDSSYDPAEYDAPSVGGLLTFDSIDMPHQPGGAPTLTATTYQQVMDPKRSPRLGAFDHSSPSSAGEAGSGSGNEGGGGGDVRSRASSISSNHASYLQQPVQQQQQMASPRLDVSQFENLRFESPHWQSQALPPNHQAYQHQHSPSPALKPQSPPHLFIPPSPPAGAGGPEGVPTINAPDGDGSSAPSLNIVPATPVGGAETARPGSQIPFQQRLDTLTQGQEAPSSQQPQPSSNRSSWDGGYPQQAGPSQHQQQQHQAQPYTFPNQHHSPSPAPSPLPQHRSPSLNPVPLPLPQQQQANGSSEYLYPQRGRSKSDAQQSASYGPPDWGIGPSTSSGHSTGNQLADYTLSGQGLLTMPPHPDDASDYSSDGGGNGGGGGGNSRPGMMGHHYTTPGYDNSSVGPQYLSPDLGGLRRVKSETRGGHRPTRSEDLLRGGNSPGMLGVNTGGLFPPTVHQEFLSPTGQETLPIRSGIAGHRRASSSSRADALGLGGGSGGGFGFGPPGGGHVVGGHSRSGSWASSARASASPYPSPHASPRYLPSDLPPQTNNIYDSSPLLHSSQLPPLTVHQQQQQQDPNLVAKPNVTTGRTADASHRRRKQDANFVCPVPGCGSTFTRSFNLKGHLRSHNDEKPFQCKWPGCGKGFARQHDCKRHEQLHSNYRPFTCEGCQKTFARMDALNRHLRSEGGTDCQRHLTDSGKQPQQLSQGQGQDDGGWTMGGGVML